MRHKQASNGVNNRWRRLRTAFTSRDVHTSVLCVRNSACFITATLVREVAKEYGRQSQPEIWQTNNGEENAGKWPVQYVPYVLKCRLFNNVPHIHSCQKCTIPRRANMLKRAAVPLAVEWHCFRPDTQSHDTLVTFISYIQFTWKQIDNKKWLYNWTEQ